MKNTSTIMTMRDQMVYTIEDLFARDERLALVLADISSGLFEKVFQRYPERAFNLGIMEQTMISVAAGLALEGFIPITHSIAPFLVERPFEQIKDDFCYQRLQGNFISNGASYDYSESGMTHQGPADVQILRNLPGMQIVVPGTAHEFDQLFRASYANGSPTYYRTTVSQNLADHPVQFGKLLVLKQGTLGTVIVVGPMLAHVLPAVEDMDVTVLYCTTIVPFDAETLRATCQGGSLIVVEPYYEGALVPDICAALQHTTIRIDTIGVPRMVFTRYGTYEEHDKALGFTPKAIRARIERFLHI